MTEQSREYGEGLYALCAEEALSGDVLEELDALLEPGDAVLVKASHFMGLTRIVEGLVN